MDTENPYQNDPLDNSGEKPIRVPGFNGVPIDLEFESWAGKRFRHGANDWRQSMRLTVREAAMLRVMDALTDKPDWTRKISEDQIVAKWRDEALQMPHMSEKAFEWCLTELRDKAEFYAKNKFHHTLDTGSRCVKSDILVDETLRGEFIQLTKPLLESPNKDYHPNSNDQVLNLVHPSLYPLVYGRTPVLNTGQVDLIKALQYCGKGDVSSVPQPPEPLDENTGDDMLNYQRRRDRQKREEKEALWSKKFQWLPCEVRFRGDQGSDVQITSYINNLHPNKYRPLYKTIEKLISLSIQPWSEVLIRGRGRTPLRITTYGAEFDPEKPEWIDELPWSSEAEDISESAWEDGIERVKEYLAGPDSSDAESDDEDDEAVQWVHDFPDGDWEENMGLAGVAEYKWKKTRHIIHPEPGQSYSYEEWKKGQTGEAAVKSRSRYGSNRAHDLYNVDLQTEWRKQGLQVLVKLASIELTPDKPEYNGGSWHVEGLLNEHIVATSIFYYDVENVTESRIDFRHEATLDSMTMNYEQDEHHPLCVIFGTNDLRDEAAIQELGSIATRQGRFIAFPNTLQHCVQPFSLVDKSKPGHRRFVVLWLVDPHYRIASTANVPPQQYEWCLEEQIKFAGINSKLPQELADMVFDEAGKNIMKLDEAKELRLELMEERTKQMPTVERGYDNYNFCEH